MNILLFDRRPKGACDTCPCADECSTMPDAPDRTDADMDAWLKRCDDAAAHKGGVRQCGWDI